MFVFRMEVLTAVRHGPIELRVLVASVELLPGEIETIDQFLLGYMNRQVASLTR